MPSKVAVGPLIADHLHTLRDGKSGRPRWQDYAIQMLLPAAAGVATPWLGARLTDPGQIIAGGSVLAGFSFGLAVFVFQLRLEAARDPRVDKGSVLLEQLDELFANVRYSVFAGLMLVVVSVAGAAFHDTAKAGALSAVWTGVIVGWGLHYILTSLMCLKRLGKAYTRLSI